MTGRITFREDQAFFFLLYDRGFEVSIFRVDVQEQGHGQNSSPKKKTRLRRIGEF